MPSKIVGVLPFDHEVAIIKAASWALFRAYPYVDAKVKTFELTAGGHIENYTRLYVGKYFISLDDHDRSGNTLGNFIPWVSSPALDAVPGMNDLWGDIAIKFYNNVAYLIDSVYASYGKDNIRDVRISFTTGKTCKLGYKIELVQRKTRDPEYSLCFKTVPIIGEYIKMLHQYRSGIIACKGQDPVLYQKLVNQTRILNPAFLS